MTFLDTTYLDVPFVAHKINKKEAKKQLIESKYSFGDGTKVTEEETKVFIDKVFDYLFKRYKKGKKKGNYSISTGDTLVSGAIATYGDGTEIEIIVSRGYDSYTCFL